MRLQTSRLNDSRLEPLLQKFEELKKDLIPPLVHAHRGKAEEERYIASYHLYGTRKESRWPNHTESPQPPEDPESRAAKFLNWVIRCCWDDAGEHARSLSYTVGIYPFKRQGEDPARMFAGRGAGRMRHQQALPLCEHGPSREAPSARHSIALRSTATIPAAVRISMVKVGTAE